LDDDEWVNLRRPVSSRVFAVVFAALLVGFVGYLVSLQFTVGGSVSGRLYIGVISLVGLFMVASFLWYALQRFQLMPTGTAGRCGSAGTGVTRDGPRSRRW
jgi:hypothetical protein